MGREREQGGGKTKRGGEKVQPGARPIYLPLPFRRQQPELICDLLPSYKSMPRATVDLQRGANAKKDRPLADLLRT